MNTHIKTLFVLLGITFVIAMFGLQYPHQQPVLGTQSTAGATYNTSRYAAVVVNAANTGTNGTSTSILNTDGTDRFVTGFRAGCQGVGSSYTANTGTGLANWQLAIGTTTAATPSSFLSFAAITTGYNLATSTVNLVVASSTTQVATSSLASVWPTNTYMTFFLNATNTAVCTFGVDYIGS